MRLIAILHVKNKEKKIPTGIRAYVGIYKRI